MIGVVIGGLNKDSDVQNIMKSSMEKGSMEVDY